MVADFLALTGTDTGGSAITSYALRYDDASTELSGTTTWTNLIGTSVDSLALTYTVTSSIQIGKTYLFQYRAKNVHGWSNDWSNSLSLIAASTPNTITPAAVTFNDQTNVRIQWTAPAYDGGKPITAYTIRILRHDGITYTSTASCNGADATVIANLYCLVPMADLRASTFSLLINEIVKVQVTSTNIIGENSPSAANTGGATIKTEPA